MHPLSEWEGLSNKLFWIVASKHIAGRVIDPCRLYNTAYILGVHRIVIFAEAEYSAECSLPKPNILPNIRHAE